MFIPSVTMIDDHSRNEDIDACNRAGILDRRRIIHIFYDHMRPNSCKVIQINISTTKGANVIFDQTFMNRNNGTLSFVAVYVYDCELNTVGKTLKEQFSNGKLTLLTSKRLDRETDHDNNSTRSEATHLYSRVYENYKISEYIDSRVPVHPYYYTQEHEYVVTNDISPYGLLEDAHSLNILGRDIIDDVTEIYKQDPSNYATVRDTILIADSDIMFGPGGLKTSASDSINEVNYLLNCDTMVNGGVFVYDSQMGMKFDKPSIICKKFLSTESVKSELESFMEAINVQATALENQYGSVRLMYAPSLIGSKCRIIYKDYDKKTSDHGLSDASKDSSHEVTETIANIIDADGMMVHKGVLEGVGHTHMDQQRIITQLC